jgi:hypothetical protein
MSLSGNPFSRSLQHTRRPLSAAFVSVVLLGALVLQANPAPAVGTCTTKPATFPVADLTKGMVAVGHTVIDGRDQTPFDVKILGVQPDGIAPGIDFILAKITGPASFLKATGGIVAGMSGSPVMIGSELLGSTSYGFFGADQTIMGITPAEQMVKIFDYPLGGGASSDAARVASGAAGSAVTLSPALRQAAAAAAGTTATQFPGTATQLPMPLGVSGLGNRAMARLRGVLSHYNVPVIVYRAGSASASNIASTPLEAGDSLGFALSYGEFTVAAVGTATATCGDLVLGYGHPVTLSGGITAGMNGADVLTVIKDPSQIFGGFKFATIQELHGTVDQDRFAGIRGMEGSLPALTPAISIITNQDLATVHNGRTDIVRDLNIGRFFIDLPTIAAFSLLGSEDAAFDRIGDGSTTLAWEIRGTGPDGDPFRLRRDDKFYSGYDATIVSIFELYGELQLLQNNRFGDVQFGHIQTTGTITQDQLTTSIRKVLVSSTSHPGLRERQTLRVRPGDTVHMRAFLHEHGGTTHAVNLTLEVPRRARGDASLQVRGGQSGFGFYGRRGVHATSFSGLIRKLEAAEHNYDLIAELEGRRGSAKSTEGGPAPSPSPGPGGSTRFERKTSVPQTQVVTGREGIRVVIVTG